ncbi:MAG TPA: hypothetical protein GX515_06550 [Firmicutes bacterium]|nr:hypothetical protein [Bacillota bacterium]
MENAAQTMKAMGARTVFHCVFRVGEHQYFLVVQDEVHEVVTIVRLSADEFAFLRRLGIPECRVIEPMGSATPGMPGIGGVPY